MMDSLKKAPSTNLQNRPDIMIKFLIYLDIEIFCVDIQETLAFQPGVSFFSYCAHGVPKNCAPFYVAAVEEQ